MIIKLKVGNALVLSIVCSLLVHKNTSYKVATRTDLENNGSSY